LGREVYGDRVDLVTSDVHAPGQGDPLIEAIEVGIRVLVILFDFQQGSEEAFYFRQEAFRLKQSEKAWH